MQLHYYLYRKKIPGATYAYVASKTRPDNRGFKIASRNYQPTEAAGNPRCDRSVISFFFSNFESEMRLRYVMKDIPPELSSRGTARSRPFITRRDNDNKVIRLALVPRLSVITEKPGMTSATTRFYLSHDPFHWI